MVLHLAITVRALTIVAFFLFFFFSYFFGVSRIFKFFWRLPNRQNAAVSSAGSQTDATISGAGTAFEEGGASAFIFFLAGDGSGGFSAS